MEIVRTTTDFINWLTAREQMEKFEDGAAWMTCASRYAELMSQKLRLDMFIPAEGDKALEMPDSVKTGPESVDPLDREENEKYVQYTEAKERVWFENWELESEETHTHEPKCITEHHLTNNQTAEGIVLSWFGLSCTLSYESASETEMGTEYDEHTEHFPLPDTIGTFVEYCKEAAIELEPTDKLKELANVPEHQIVHN